MEVWDWLQLLGAGVSAVLLALSVAWHRAAIQMRSLDQFNEVWEWLYRSRLALGFAVLFALLALAAAYDESTAARMAPARPVVGIEPGLPG